MRLDWCVGIDPIHKNPRKRGKIETIRPNIVAIQKYRKNKYRGI